MASWLTKVTATSTHPLARPHPLPIHVLGLALCLAPELRPELGQVFAEPIEPHQQGFCLMLGQAEGTQRLHQFPPMALNLVVHLQRLHIAPGYGLARAGAVSSPEQAGVQAAWAIAGDG